MLVFFSSYLVHLYSTKYLSHDPHLLRFRFYLLLFTFFMLILVTADNYFQMFVGWEGSILCFYLLMNSRFIRIIKANEYEISRTKVLWHRIGNFSLVIRILLLVFCSACVFVSLGCRKVCSIRFESLSSRYS